MSATLWNQCLSQLEVELSEGHLNTYIRPLQAHESPSLLRIMAPNRFVLTKVQSSFYPRICELATGISKDPSMTVKLVVGTEVLEPLSTKTESPVPELETAGASNSDTAGSNHSSSRASGLKQKTTSADQDDSFDAAHASALNPMFTFDTLVKGKSNQLGHAAAMQIGLNPGAGAYNPFLIYGQSGLGKTHLMQSIGHAILESNPTARVLYLNSEKYVVDMVYALQKGKMDAFKRYYRNLDALLIDDIQFLAKKEQSQEEFFHNFNALFEGAKQIVLTCDRYPKEVPGLADRLKTRFGWGLTVAVEPPEMEMRMAILNSKAAQSGVTLPQDVSMFIAQRIASNVRELEGALKRVLANALFTGSPITIDFARDALSDLLAVQAKLVTIENIQKTVAEYFNIRLADLSGKSRSRSIARPRQIAMSIAKELTSKSLPEIGQAFGGRDHTTVLHACRKIAELKESDNAVREDCANLLRILTS